MLLDIHQEIKTKLNEFYESNRIPHIIFNGPSGSGKQTLVQEFLKKIYRYNENMIKNNVMHVNCSHGKGIKFIREDLKFFAKTNVQLNGGYYFKSVVLLNADNLTIDAQSALRRCIEQYSKNTRFFIIVENKQGLLPPIISRFCNIFVPYPIINQKQVNLHMNSISNQTDTQTKAIQLEISEELSPGKWNHKELMNMVNRMYDNGICCMDIVNWASEQPKWTKKEKSEFNMCFIKVKPEFRCEKLLMLYILDFIFYRISDPLHELSFL